MDMSPYRDLFVAESHDHIKSFSELLVKLETEPVDKGAINELFRHAHSLKGMAATMLFEPVADLAHAMEDLLSKVRSGEFKVVPTMIDLLLEGNDALSSMISTIEAGKEPQSADPALTKRLVTFDPQTHPEPKPAAVPEVKPAATEPETPPSRRSDSFKSIRVKTEVFDRLVNITGELITTRHRLADQAIQIASDKLNEPLTRLAGLLRELRDEVLQARMLPFGIVSERFPRLVRDLARKQGKEISFVIEGNDIELDRGILEEISEPLVHILRNAVDHGMEQPEERVKKGKPADGRIVLKVSRDKDQINVVVSDDGRGMNSSVIIKKAVEKGVITSDQATTLSIQEALMLVCAPGFSTAATVSDISGRGVGMDAVRSAVHTLGGSLSIETSHGNGSTFTIKLPISISIINALLVQCGKLVVAFPVNAIDRAVELSPVEIQSQEDGQFCTRETPPFPLKSLNQLLGQQPPSFTTPFIPAVVTQAGGSALGLITDRILGQQEIFIKPLGQPLASILPITGGAILGDGRIVFVMDAGMLA